MPGLGIEPATLAYQDEGLTSGAIFFKLRLRKPERRILSLTLELLRHGVHKKQNGFIVCFLIVKLPALGTPMIEVNGI